MSAEYQMCSRCIMDITDPDITFDDHGICNHCRQYEKEARKLALGEEGRTKLQEIANQIKERGRNEKYDCILGVSGGVDSSFVAYHAKKLDLRPLLVHCDNGWNSEISVKNIENLVRKLNFDLYTYVIDWEEFKDLQLSFMKASVVDIEMLTDHAIMAVMFNLAEKNRIRYILSGSNIATEGIMPRAWLFPKWDIRNIKAIHKRFGQKKLATFPVYGFLRKFIITKYFRRMHYVRVLDFVDYNKKRAMDILEKEVGWQYYGGKHYESTFTKFYQAYILPRKFNIDKRKPHLSTLICSGQMTREQALEEMKRPLYDPKEIEADKEYVLKKLGLSSEIFAEIMNRSVMSHLDYPNSQKWLAILNRLL